jgi:hypothetical protein
MTFNPLLANPAQGLGFGASSAAAGAHHQQRLVVNNSNVTQFNRGMFATPPHAPNPLFVVPPTVQIPRPTKRFTDAHYCNPNVPSYIPPEAFLYGDGRFADLFLMRARLDDMRRLKAAGLESLYFMRAGGELPRGFRGSAGEELHHQREQRYKDFETARTRYSTEDAKRAENSGPAGGTRRGDKGGVTCKVMLTEQQVQSGTVAALFGYRGSTHKMLLRELNLNALMVGGRGITDPRKQRPEVMSYQEAIVLAQEPPHVKLTASNESDLQRAVQRIEFFLSDDPEAINERETLSRRGAIENGFTYRGGKYARANAVREAAAAAARAAGRTTGVAATGAGSAAVAADDDVNNLLNVLGK